MTDAPLHSRHLAWDACMNVRNLDGLPAADGKRLRAAALVRSDYPGRLTTEGRTALRAYGIHTAIDLRTANELGIDPPAFRDPPDPDVNYLHLPFFTDDEQFAAELRATNSSIEVYRLFLERWPHPVAAIVTAIATAPEGGVLIHCYSGKDRTGVITALLLSLFGVPDDIIAADFALSDENLRHWYAEILAQTDNPRDRERLERQIFTAFPETILATLEYLRDYYGGAEAYLLQAGVTEADIERLRTRLLD